MALNDVQIDLIIQTAESAKNLGDLRKSMQEVRKTLDQVELGSTAFTKLNATLDDGAERLRTFRRGFDGLKAFETFGRTITSSFGVASAAIASFAEGNDQLQKSLTRVGAALTLVQSFASLGEAIKQAEQANQAFNASLLTNPYVLVAAGIAAAVGALILFNDEEDKTVQKTKELKLAADDLVQSFSDERFVGGVKDLADELNRIKENGGGIKELQAFLKKIDEEGASGRLAVTFADINKELATLKEREGVLQGLAVDLKNGGESFSEFIKGNGLLAGQLTNEFKRTGDAVKAIENVLKIVKSDITTYNQLQELQRKAHLEILDIEKKKSEELAKQKVDIKDFLSAYNQIVTEQGVYISTLQGLGANQETINNANLSYYESEKVALQEAITLTEDKIKVVKVGTDEYKAYVAQLAKETSELTNIRSKIEISTLGSDTVFRNIFGTSATDAQTILKNEFQKLLEPIRKQIAEQISISPAKLASGLIDMTQNAANIDRLNTAYKSLQNELISFQSEQDNISGRIETSQIKLKKFFEIFQNVNGITDFSQKFSNISTEIGKINTELSGRFFGDDLDKLIQSVNKGVKPTDLAAFINIIRNVYQTYNTTITDVKTSLDKLYKEGKISRDEYLQSVNDTLSQTLGGLDVVEGKIQNTINAITDPKKKQVVQDFFKAISLSATTANASLTTLVTENETYLNTEQEKQRQVFDKTASAFEARSQQLFSLIQQASDARIQVLENEKQRAIDLLQGQFDAQLISQQQFREKTALIEEEYRQKEREEKKAAFAAGKAGKIIEAIINTALAVSAAIAVGPPAGYILAAISGALGAAQIGIIASQPTPEYATGGYVAGPGSATSDSINAKISNGEYIVNSKSTSAFRPLLDQINYGMDYGFTRLNSETKAGKETTNQVTQNDKDIRVSLVYSDVQLAAQRTNDIKVKTTF